MCLSRARLPFKALLLPLAFALFAAPTPLFADQPGDSIQIFVPENLTSVSSDNAVAGEKRGSISVQSTTGKKISLVGKYDGKDLPEMEIVNNGRSLVIPVFHKNYFHARIILSLGINMVEVRWKKPGAASWNTKSVSIFRASKLEGGVTTNYPPYAFHKGDNDERCQECHQMRLTKAEKETGMERSCLKCHTALAENPLLLLERLRQRTP